MSKIKNLSGLICKNNIEAFLITGTPNIRYISNFSGEEGFLLALKDEIFLIVDSRFTEQAKKETLKGINVIEYKGNFATFLEQMLLNKKTHWLGIEKNRINYSLYISISSIPFIKIVPLENVIEGMRLIKDKKEVEILKKGFEAAVKSFNETIKFIKEGVSENDIAAELEYRFRKNGGEKPAFDTIVASGERGALPHGVASSKKIKAHEPIVIDFGLLFQGYATDITRTVIVGKPTAEIKKVYEVVKKAQAFGREIIKSGAKASQVDLEVRKLIKDRGYGDCFMHGLGHGVGLEVHESPTLNGSSNYTLETNMVVTVEPGVYLKDKFGIRIEDTVLVTKDNYTNFVSLSHELIIL